MPDEDLENNGADREADGAATATAPVKKPADTERKPRQLPPYKLLLHNDDVNTFDLTPIQEEEAIVKTIEAHETGVALLLVTHCERAELYVDQFTSLNVTVTIESDNG